ncbi:MAG TPA: redox-regulated ATPase YchF [Candidatus Absconditabacterales bacterium]|nr:redox-regulated ATPase YchF [Candidatus Absconditabacterales bacterium]HRU50402.1 redox-regulated ATPase YchF [Candidatus Absconditabacterales bacterium]
MKIGIVGLPNVGKSTLFNALTNSYSAPAENFPFCTIEPNVGIVDVKDPRIEKLAEISQTKKIIHANIEFVDIAGLVRGAGKGEGLGNKFLSNIREVDAIVQVLRYFKDADVVHVEGEVNLMRDIDIINSELIFSDLEKIERILPGIKKKMQTTGDKFLKREVEILELIQQTLEGNKLANTIVDQLDEQDMKLIRSYGFLTIKPFVYAINVGQDDIPNKDQIQKELQEKLQSPVVIVCAKLESEMMGMEKDEKIQFVSELLEIENIENIPTLDDLITLAFDTVGLMYYFTTGEKETRAWTIKKGFTAPQAAGVIHTDFERGFIKAEVVSYDDFISYGGWNKVKENGKLRLEGKDYVVQDGDIIVFKFNV